MYNIMCIMLKDTKGVKKISFQIYRFISHLTRVVMQHFRWWTIAMSFVNREKKVICLQKKWNVLFFLRIQMDSFLFFGKKFNFENSLFIEKPHFEAVFPVRVSFGYSSFTEKLTYSRISLFSLFDGEKEKGGKLFKGNEKEWMKKNFFLLLFLHWNDFKYFWWMKSCMKNRKWKCFKMV